MAEATGNADELTHTALDPVIGTAVAAKQITQNGQVESWRCYDCGYPITQSGSSYGSLAGAHVEGSAKSARGNDTTNNFNPQGIIGRIN